MAIILKTTVPSSSTKGNKVIEFNNVSLSLSKTNYSLKFGTATSNTYVPEQDKINVFALSFDINENFAKLYRNGTLIETISCDGYNIENDCYYMLANDMIHHALLIYDKALSTEQIGTLTNDLGGVN